MTLRFEEEWEAHNGLGSVAFGGWAGGALAALDFCGVRGEPVLCPSNTFMATPLAIQAAFQIRLDALTPATKRVALVGSVYGGTLWRESISP